MPSVWMWVIGGLAVWAVAAVFVGVLLGRGIHLADRSSPDTGVDAPPPAAERPVATGAPAVRQRRHRIPLPPIGVALAATVVGLQAVGYALRLGDATGPNARLLSMDAPYSVPRLFIAALFAAAAVAALIAAGRIPGRRAWWLSVGLVAGVISVVKTGSTVHTVAMDELGAVVGTVGAVGVSAAVALLVLGTLAFISRAERRDRRRVLLCLAAYAGAAVGLSAIADAVSGSFAVTMTFLEESAEGLAGVAFLVAVLTGVAPRLVLPAAWALRRQADAHTLEVAPEPRPGQAPI